MDEREFEGINMIPFIDIMLVLLTIVLTTATFIAKGTVPIHLPTVRHGTAGSQGLTITIDRDGTIYFQGARCDKAALRTALSTKKRQTQLLIRADRATALQSFVDVMDIIRNLGFARMSLQTRVRQ